MYQTHMLYTIDIGKQNLADFQEVHRKVQNYISKNDASLLLAVEFEPIISFGQIRDKNRLSQKAIAAHQEEWKANNIDIIAEQPLSEKAIQYLCKNGLGGIPCIDPKRPGGITYHGTGSFIVFPVLNLTKLNLSFGAYKDGLESSVIQTLYELTMKKNGSFHFDEQKDACLYANGCEYKVGSVGISHKFLNKHEITGHGFSLHTTRESIAGTRFISPCGISLRDLPVSPLENHIMGTIDRKNLFNIFKNRFAQQFGIETVSTLARLGL